MRNRATLVRQIRRSIPLCLCIFFVCDSIYMYHHVTIQCWVGRGSTEKVRDYIERGGNLKRSFIGTHNLLMIAVENGHYEIAQMFLAAGVDPNATPGDQSPLHLAVRHDDLKMASILLEKGANPNWSFLPQNRSSGYEAETTPFYWAVLKKNRRMIELLLDHGADPRPYYLGLAGGDDIQELLSRHLDRQGEPVR